MSTIKAPEEKIKTDRITTLEQDTPQNRISTAGQCPEPAPEHPAAIKSNTAAETAESDQPVLIDTSKMSAGQRAALELTEAARDAEKQTSSFAANLFMGKLSTSQIFPFPLQNSGDAEKGDKFAAKLEDFLRSNVDPDEIDRTGEIPADVISQLGAMGAFGIKIGTEYGGLGLSQTNYCRAAMMLGSYCGNLTALVSAHQSIGVPQPLILFGTEEQKKRFLPRFAKGEISAFALTEPNVGSDPAKMETKAEPTPDGKHFIINGEKLWCTNGTKASVIVVMAKTPSKIVHGKSKNQVTAFIVEMNSPGIEIVQRCRFMGLKALYNGVIRFKDVKVPVENIILGEGKGLRVALSTLNTGRLTLPAACTGLAKKCLQISREWANDRVQWGAPIGKHSAIADKIARMAANTFAMESMTLYTASLVDKNKKADIRLEAAMCKMWGTEMAWQIVDETMQIRGGRGFETAASLKERGEKAVPVERLLRDSRINTIFEGSSEIMRLFLAREALDPHLQVAGAVLNSRLPFSVRMKAAVKAGMFYAKWYPKQWLPFSWDIPGGLNPRLRSHMRFVSKTSRKLARTLFHAMAIFGPKLERQQVLLGRFVEIGTELFAITASCSRAQAMINDGHSDEAGHLLSLVDFFCRNSRLKVKSLFLAISNNNDSKGYRLTQNILSGKHSNLESGILK